MNRFTTREELLKDGFIITEFNALMVETIKVQVDLIMYRYLDEKYALLNISSRTIKDETELFCLRMIVPEDKVSILYY